MTLDEALRALERGKREDNPVVWDAAEQTLIDVCESEEAQNALQLVSTLFRAIDQTLDYTKNPDGDDSVVTGWLDSLTGGWDRGEWAMFGASVATMIAFGAAD